jgi:hypothetical protein
VFIGLTETHVDPHLQPRSHFLSSFLVVSRWPEGVVTLTFAILSRPKQRILSSATVWYREALIAVNIPLVHAMVGHERRIPGIAPQLDGMDIVESADFVSHRSLLCVQKMLRPRLEGGSGVYDLDALDARREELCEWDAVNGLFGGESARHGHESFLRRDDAA